MDHLRMAGAHAAGSVAEMIAPRMDVMRERMIEPAIDKSVDMARDGARRAGVVARRATGKKPTMKARRWPRMAGGLMIAGVALGAVSALLARRRQRKWNEYESTGAAITGEARSVADSARSAASSMTETAKEKAETAKEKASDVMSQMKEATGTSPSSVTPPPSSVTPPPSSGSQPSVTPPSTTGTGESLASGSTGSGSRNGRP
ncbi:hypothetical protein HC031_04105 [Planosporangium thailandense]|uniref:YtxH domain-containing protein n=1 Tax=Planosporangium thailandense TaxID=765197 RepID=A0ABX0XSC8_9ACTN|nr:hypothetical protein [Planosporangium thailandense]NJC68912.1 hypothetical protein [Planosporangium thailandense]